MRRRACWAPRSCAEVQEQLEQAALEEIETMKHGEGREAGRRQRALGAMSESRFRAHAHVRKVQGFQRFAELVHDEGEALRLRRAAWRPW